MEEIVWRHLMTIQWLFFFFTPIFIWFDFSYFIIILWLIGGRSAKAATRPITKDERRASCGELQFQVNIRHHLAVTYSQRRHACYTHTYTYIHRQWRWGLGEHRNIYSILQSNPDDLKEIHFSCWFGFSCNISWLTDERSERKYSIRNYPGKVI